MLPIGTKVKLPKYHIDIAEITTVYEIDGYYGITGKTSPGGYLYQNKSFPSEEVLVC